MQGMRAAMQLQCRAQADQARSKQIKNWTYDNDHDDDDNDDDHDNDGDDDKGDDDDDGDDSPTWPPVNLPFNSFDGAR